MMPLNIVLKQCNYGAYLIEQEGLSHAEGTNEMIARCRCCWVTRFIFYII